MKYQELRFGDKVTITKPGFFNGTKGTVVGVDFTDGKYDVMVKFNRQASFYSVELKRVPRKRKASK